MLMFAVGGVLICPAGMAMVLTAFSLVLVRHLILMASFESQRIKFIMLVGNRG